MTDPFAPTIEPREPRLGCVLTAHRDIGYCCFCAGLNEYDELAGWRHLAIQEKGTPKQPFEKT